MSIETIIQDVLEYCPNLTTLAGIMVAGGAAGYIIRKAQISSGPKRVELVEDLSSREIRHIKENGLSDPPLTYEEFLLEYEIFENLVAKARQILNFLAPKDAASLIKINKELNSNRLFELEMFLDGVYGRLFEYAQINREVAEQNFKVDDLTKFGMIKYRSVEVSFSQEKLKMYGNYIKNKEDKGEGYLLSSELRLLRPQSLPPRYYLERDIGKKSL